jgi:hypothetical protein
VQFFSPFFSALPEVAGRQAVTLRAWQKKAAAGAVVERLVPICIAQFSADPQQALKLTELQAITSSSKRVAFVKEQGWATMPGETAPDSKVATQCTNQIMLSAQ